MFTASDGTQIDITEHIAPENRAVIVLWPCMTGNTAMYRLPVNSFGEAGISTVQFNPRGHGNSEGQFDLELCTRDLNEYLDRRAAETAGKGPLADAPRREKRIETPGQRARRKVVKQAIAEAARKKEAEKGKPGAAASPGERKGPRQPRPKWKRGPAAPSRRGRTSRH